MTLLKKLRSTITRHNLLSSGDIVIVGVSGGSDSVCLVNALSRLNDFHLKIIIAHINHCLRGSESERDAEFVRQVARDLGLEFELLVEKASLLKKQMGKSIEESARTVRYRFFDVLTKKYNAQRVATAHTFDDQVETVLMRFIRGSGIKGLSGIPYFRQPNIIRPFLDISKDEIGKFLEYNKIRWVEDSSNIEEEFLRNRIRHKVIPLLKELNPNLDTAIKRTSEIFSENESYISLVTGKAYRKVFKKNEYGLYMGNLKEFKRLHTYIKFSLIREAISRLNENLLNIDFEHVYSAMELLTSEKISGEINLPGDIIVARSYDNFVITSRSKIDPRYSYTVDSFGEYKYEHVSFKLERARVTKLDLGKNIALISPRKLKFPFVVRNFKPGDKFIPLGMKGEKKLKDFFIDEKVPRYLRKLYPLFVINGEIAWVGGLRLSENFKVRGKECVRIELFGFNR